MSIINGKQRGSYLGDLESIDIPIKEIQKFDYFLDKVTGDMYSYNIEKHDWKREHNTGIHDSNAANRLMKVGNYVLNTPPYRPKGLLDNMSLTQSIYEAVCYVKKTNLNHWTVSGLPSSRFISYIQRSSWKIHPFLSKVPFLTVNIIVEDDSEPLLIEVRNSISFKFDISHKYPETVLIIKNFAYTCVNQIQGDYKGTKKSIFEFFRSKINVELTKSLKNRINKAEERTYKFEELDFAKNRRNAKKSIVDRFSRFKEMRASQYASIKHSANSSFSSLNEQDEDLKKMFSASEVRKALHPTLPTIKQRELWVPGDYNDKSKTKKSNSNSRGKTSISNPRNFQIEQKNKFTSINAFTPYLSFTDVTKLQDKSSREKSLGKPYFSVSPDKLPNRKETTPHFGDGWKVARNHKFRKVEKDKWVDKDFKV